MRQTPCLLIPVTVFALVVCAAVSVPAQTVMWDPNQEVDIAGYRVHYGPTAENLSTQVDVGNNTTYRPDLDWSRRWYFAVQAYDTVGQVSPLSTVVGWVPSLRSVLDFDGDGRPDILWRNSSTGEMLVWYMNGTTRTRSASFGTQANLDWRIFGFGDFNGDARPDIVWRNRLTGENYVCFTNISSCDGGTGALDRVADLDWTIAGVADFDADTKPDILWRNTATGANHVWFMNGVTRMRGVDLDSATDLNWRIVGVADFNADTNPDILWRNVATGANHVWLMSGVTRTRGVDLDSSTDPNWRIVAVADFDADTNPDILWRNSVTGENYVWFMSGVSRSGGTYLDTVADTNWLISDSGQRTPDDEQPGTLQLGAATYAVAETGGTVSLTVTRAGGSAGAVSATVASANLTATAGSDYTAVSQVVSFADGDAAAKTVTIPILADAVVEGSETFAVALSAPTGGAGLATPASAKVTITDDDVTTLTVFPSTLQFAAVVDRSGMWTTAVTPAQEVWVEATGGTPAWTVTADAPWVVVIDGSGAGTGLFSVGVQASGAPVSGTASATVTLTNTASGKTRTMPVTLTVKAKGTTVAPTAWLDTPVAGSTHAGAIAVTGWAIDDVAVTRVEIWRAPVAVDPPAAIQPNGRVYVGKGTFLGGARPDVEAGFPTVPQAHRAGWGFQLLSNMLPHQGKGTPAGGQGPFTIYAVVVDADGHTTDVPVKVDENGNPTEFSVAITVDNEGSVKPFGVLDTPDQGGTASGAAYVNFGWALAKQPKLIPTDGSTMWVFVDGQPLGHPSYGHYRSDIATLFPGYRNSDGAVGYFYLDTTTLTPGLHSIQWSVTDDAGVTEGIGSRLFTVLNTRNGNPAPAGAGAQAVAAAESAAGMTGSGEDESAGPSSAGKEGPAGSEIVVAAAPVTEDGVSTPVPTAREAGGTQTETGAATTVAEGASRETLAPRREAGERGAETSVGERAARRDGSPSESLSREARLMARAVELLAEAPEQVPEAAGAPSYRLGFDLTAPFEVVPAGADGRPTVTLPQLTRLEVQLGPADGSEYTVWVRGPQGLQPLSVAATLDAANATLAWQLTVGHLETYDLVILRVPPGGDAEQLPLRVRVVPR